ncbi:hypothetical protein ES703_112770 [subsurface metagenome]
MRIFKLIFGAAKPFLRNLDVKIDRQTQTITFERAGQVEILTVDQLFDEIESLFATPGAPVIMPTLGSNGRRLNGPREPQEAPQEQISLRAWLTKCDKPLKNPFKYIDQPFTEPARPPAADQTEDLA